MDRTILHLDLDSFFVSVERLLKPELIGKPVIVGSDQARSVVSSCSYEARTFGIKSGMSGREAKRLCPEAIFTYSTNGEYGTYSKIVAEIVHEMLPNVTQASIDEFYGDLTGTDRFYGSWHLARTLRKRIIKETGLPISMGLSTNKIVSKIATGVAKPNGELMIPQGMEQSFLFPLKVEKIPGVGEKTLPILHKYNIKTIGDLAKQDINLLEDILGTNGYFLLQKAKGNYDSTRYEQEERKSISTENTFKEDIVDTRAIDSVLKGMIEKLCFKLRAEQLHANCVALKLRLPNFSTFSKQVAIEYTNTDEIIFNAVKALRKSMLTNKTALMLIGVRLSGLKHSSIQTNLFINHQEALNIYSSIDKIRLKYGLNSIYRADSTISFRKL